MYMHYSGGVGYLFIQSFHLCKLQRKHEYQQMNVAYLCVLYTIIRRYNNNIYVYSMHTLSTV